MTDPFSQLKKLRTPGAIQDFLDALPINHEKQGETCMGPIATLQAQKAHCLEGALLAATALALQGERPLLMNLKSSPGDQDHAVALFRKHGYWGAFSKTNHAVLRYRDPIYKTPRELALSYFHEYFLNSNGRKTLLAYSKPFDLSRFPGWMEQEVVWDIAHALRDAPHTKIVPPENKRYVRPASTIERQAGKLIEWKNT